MNNHNQEEILNNLLKEDLAVWFGTKKKPKGSKQPNGPWVNICRKKEGGGHPPCGASAGSKTRKGGKRAYPKCVPASKATSMTAKQKRSAVSRKRKKGATGRGKAKMVSTYTKG